MYGVALTTPIPNAAYFRGYTPGGSIVALVGVDPAGRVAIDPNAVGTDVFGNVLLVNPAAYLNWDTTVGTGGFGIRANAGAIEFKNSGGAWSPIAAAAASAGGWTDDGAVVRLDTGTDQVGIGTATPLTGSQLHVSATDGAQRLFFNGTTKGIRVGFDASQSIIQGMDNTASTYQPLLIAGSEVKILVSTVEMARFYSSILVINDTGADFDVRIESDANASHIVSDGGLFSGVGATGFGIVPQNTSTVIIAPPSLTATANALYARLEIGSQGPVTIPTGTAAIVSTVQIAEPNITATGTVNDAYSLVITGQPTEATRNGALWTTGNVRLTSLPTAAAGLPAGSLWNNAGVVNIV